MRLKKLEKKIAFYFKITKKAIIFTEEDEDFKNINICRFCEKEVLSHKVTDHCHLTGKCRVPAHSKCNITVTQDKVTLFLSNFTIFVILILICSLKNS